MAAAQFPTSLPPLSTITSSMTLLGADLAEQQDTDRNELRAIATKLGLGTATATRGQVLIATGSGSSAWERMSSRNLLPNPFGAVHQRVSAASIDMAYGPDMWRLLLETASAGTLNQVTGGLPTNDSAATGFILTIGSAPNNKLGMWCPVHAYTSGHLRGAACSLQLKMRASNARIGDVRAAPIAWTGTANNGGAAWPDPISAWGAAGTNPTLSGSWAYCGVPVNLSPTLTDATYRVEGLPVPSTMKNMGVVLWIDDKSTATNDYLVVTDIQLEAGDFCTDVDRPSFEETYGQAQQYYRKSVPIGTAPVANSTAEAWPTFRSSVPDTTLLAKVNFGFPMAGTPTVRIWPWATASNTSRCSNSSGVDLAANSAAPYVPSPTGFGVQNASGGALAVPSDLVLFGWDAVAPW